MENQTQTPKLSTIAKSVKSQFLSDKEASALISRISKNAQSLHSDIYTLCLDLVARLRLVGDFSKPEFHGYGDLTLVNRLLKELFEFDAQYEKVGQWFIAHTGGGLKWDKKVKYHVERVKGKGFTVVDDLDDLPHPLTVVEKGELSDEAKRKKEVSRLDYNTRINRLIEQAKKLVAEYNEDLSKIAINESHGRPKLDVENLIKLESISGSKLTPLEKFMKDLNIPQK